MAHYAQTTVILLALLYCISVKCTKESENLRPRRQTSAAVNEAYYFVTELFWKFGDDKKLSMDALKSIVINMELEGMYHDHGSHDGHDHGDHDGHNHEGHDHGDHEGHDHGDHEGHDHGDHEGHDHGDHEGHDHDDHEGHDHDEHEGHDHDDHDGHDHHQHKRAVADNTNNVDTVDEECPTMSDMLSDYQIENKDSMSPDDFLYLCPALVYYYVNGVCGGHSDHHDGHNHSHEGAAEEDDREMGLVWFYLMLSVTVISMCAVWGILCIPKKSRSSYEMVIQFLMALGAGSMAGDALLHLLPHALMPPHDHSAHSGHEGHGHDDHEGHEDHGDHGDEHMEALLKGLVSLIGLYSFFALERFFSILLARSSPQSGDTKKPCGLHSHGEPLENVVFITNSESNNTGISELSPCTEEHATHHWPHAHNEQGEAPPSEDSSTSSSFCPKLTPLAMMIVLGDMFHNFCDGVAMGAAYSSSTTIGISTSLAVFAHEFPHEVGDFAILIKSGLTRKWAVALNFASALTCYMGAVIGMILGNSVGNAPMWIFAGVAGMFLYIALVDLIPEMTHIYTSPGKRWGVFLSLHAAGLFFGSLFMFILGIYEHDIQTALG